MAMKYKTVGGTAQPGSLGDAFTQFLQGGITGSFPGGGGAAGGASGVFGDILSAGAGQYGGALKTLMDQQKTSDLATLREQYGNGASFGTGGAYAASNYLAKAAPAFTTSIAQTQLGALGQLLPMIQAMAARQIPQAQNVGVQSPWIQGLNILGQLGGDVAQFIPFTHPNTNQNTSGYESLPQLPTPDYGSMFQLPNWNNPNLLGVTK